MQLIDPNPDGKNRHAVLGWIVRSPAVCLAVMLLVAATYFGSTRDFGIFLLSVPVLALLAFASFFAAIQAAVVKPGRSSLAVAGPLICLAPLAYLFSYGPFQQLRFFIWAPAHYSQLAQASKKNAVVMGWDSWGMAGQDTFSYLVADTEDRLSSKSRMDRWIKEVGQTCGSWEVQRVWPRLYIVTTYTNCPYDGVEPAN